MQKVLLTIITFTIISVSANAQYSRYIIKFKNKGTNPFSISNPSQFLTQRAIDRRTRYNIAIDSTDLPITPRYLDSIRAAGAVTILNTSKWLNQVLIKTSDAVALTRINNMSFVVSASPIAPLIQTPPVPHSKLGVLTSTIDGIAPVESDNLLGYYNYGKSNGQIKIHKADFLHNLGFRGEGMQMAVLDAGFFGYQTLSSFDSIRRNNQILGTWDFVNNEASVNEDDKHGMYCLSIIAANLPGVFVGSAPKTSFYLYRTEDVFSEFPVEEQNYVAGLERADSLGVDICSTSLGYYNFDNPVFNYTYSDMNGNVAISTRGADLASKKGMLVVVANGNEGNSTWKFLIAPADADSVLAVGAVDTLGNVASFSSYGPSSDGQVKPNVASVGWNAVISNSTTGAPAFGNGTSFACPNMAGITTSLWQAFPEVNNFGIIQVLQQSASKASNPDTRVGYGIPDVKKAFVLLTRQLFNKQSTINGCNVSLNFNVKSDANMSFVIERKIDNQNTYIVAGTRQGTGSFALKNVSFSEDISALAATTIQYRIRMDISTDTSFYLDSLVVNNTNCVNNPSNEILITPNPVIDDLNVRINRLTAAGYDILIFNAAGQQVYKTGGQQAAGMGNITVPMQQFSPGMYYVTVLIDKKKVLTKEVLKR